MGFRCGFVGLPNVGKSTLFNALTRAQVESANFPFCTIDPNTGSIPVPEPRLEALARITQPERIVPCQMTFIDIAGLIEGSSKGEGLGNKFLANIRETEAIAHVVRCFEDESVVHVGGKVSPEDDIEIINTELLLSDLDVVTRVHRNLTKVARARQKEALRALPVVSKALERLEDGVALRSENWNEGELTILEPYRFLTLKPVMYIANTSEDMSDSASYLSAVNEIANKESAKVVAVSSRLEAEISQLPACERAEYLELMALEETGLDRVIRQGYDLLDLHHYFTAGPKEVRAWTIPKGTRAAAAAGKIHTDFEKGFIRAEVIAYEDYVENDGENGAKSRGLLRLEGRDYIVQDGDVMHFRFNV